MNQRNDNRSKYLACLEALVRRLHTARLARLGTSPTRPGEWCGKYQFTQNLAFLYALLFKFGGKPGHLRLARRYLLDFEQGFHFSAIFCGQAYEILRSRLSPVERKAFAAGWTRGAAEQLGRYLGPDRPELARLDNVWNHAICACVYADYARRLFPEEAAALGMEKITDKVWQSWWQTGEFWEQASNYEGLAVASLCFWAELRGLRREFYAGATIRNIFERQLRVVSPAGLVAPYGDSGYNEQVTSWIALFEKVGRATGDGRYVSAARDIFDALLALKIGRMPQVLERMLGQDPCNIRMAVGQLLHALAWLGLAALWSNPRLAPAARPPAVGLIRRLPPGHRLSERDRKTLPDDRLVPGQVALAGGPRAKPTFLLLAVGPQLSHDHADAGAIHLLSRGRTHLLGTCGYLQQELLYHNLFYVQETSRRPYPDDTPGKERMGDKACGGQLQELRSQDQSAYARLVFEKYHGFPVHLTREILVDGAGCVTLFDKVVARAPGYCGGLLFHGERVRRDRAGRWLLRLDRLLSMCGTESVNPAGQLRIELLAPAAAAAVRTLRLPAVYDSDVYRRFPCNLYKIFWARSYNCRRCLAFCAGLPPDRPLLFITRLTPV